MTARRIGAIARFVAAATAIAFVGARAGDEPASAPVAPTVAAVPTTGLRFHVPADAVTFHGAVSYDAAGLADAPILYVGGPVGLVAGVITHSLISNARRQRQKDEINAQADVVLEPYADAIAGFAQRDLLVRSFDAMTTVAGKSVGDPGPASEETWVIDYVPVFAMNQDRRAIVLDNAVSITRLDRPSAAAYRNTIRVVSAAPPVQDIDWWEVDHSANIKAESARLLAMSFDVALVEARRDRPVVTNPPVQRTLRIRIGDDERMERAEPIAQTCDRITMRTLRGWLLSAPPSRPPTTDGDGRPCVTAAPMPN